MRYFKPLILVSFIFIAYQLYSANYLKVPHILSYPFLFSSIFVLFLGNIIQPVAWKKITDDSNFKISWTESLAAELLPVFSKYIPGKVWIILGPPTYIHTQRNYSIKRLSILSLELQLIMLWSALVSGSVVLFLYGGFKSFGWLVLILWFGLTMMLFTNLFHRIGSKVIFFTLKKDLQIPKVRVRSVFAIILWSFLGQIIAALGFYLFISSLVDYRLDYAVGFSVVLASAIGIISFFAPGGLGVKEGVLVGCLSLTGISMEDAVTIAFSSRLWSIVVEIMLFFTGLIAAFVIKRNKRRVQRQVY